MALRLSTFLVLLWGTLADLRAEQQDHGAITVDQMATHYAGLVQGGAFETLENRPSFQVFAAELNRRWQDIAANRSPQLAQFRQHHLKVSHRTLFYPMAGPDAFHGLSFFPNAKTTILVGLERIGRLFPLPELANEKVYAQLLDNIQNGTSSLFARSFFITMDMSKDYYFGGVTPTLLTLLKRMDAHILSVRGVGVDGNGALITPQNFQDIEGVEIVFRRAAHIGPQKLYYFRQNLDNRHIKASFLKFVAEHKPLRTFFKSSSYTPHQGPFSRLVDFVLENSGLILQDDSGIPYRAFNRQNWQISLYGTYQGPYGESFTAYHQKDLEKAFQGSHVHPLPFRIGYGYGQAPSNLLIARWR